MGSITVNYGGTEIHTASTPETFTLSTDGKYMNGDFVIKPYIDASSVLEDNEWATIHAVAQAGTGADYWSVGDTKSVTLSGTIGTLSINTTLYVYIIGINHRETNGITFQGFKTAQSNGNDICFISRYNAVNSSGNLSYFNLNHWGDASAAPYNTNYGGWAACDMRYDILGSTNVAPSPYGSEKATSAAGSSPTATCATSPKANTLLSCFPSDLRRVMKPMTIWTDNKGNANNVASSVTTSIDYLPLLSESEVFGTRTFANQYEQTNQTQYQYYSSGNSKIKYRHDSQSSAAMWWLRSPVYSGTYNFCFVYSNGNDSNGYSHVSIGISPMFLV